MGSLADRKSAQFTFLCDLRDAYRKFITDSRKRLESLASLSNNIVTPTLKRKQHIPVLDPSQTIEHATNDTVIVLLDCL